MMANDYVPCSMLDSDLYKFTMQQAVLAHFPGVQAVYRFTNRTKSTRFSGEMYEALKRSIESFRSLELTSEELDWLRRKCAYFSEEYLSYLQRYRFKPEQVKLRFTASNEDASWGDIEMDVEGPWEETILWETPLLAALSEVYYRIVNTDWSYEGQEEQAFQKGSTLVREGLTYSEFGARRRRSYESQDLVIHGLNRATRDVKGSGALVGTSNVHFAHKYDLIPSGTIAHEWFMGVSALRGYENASTLALELWEQTFPTMQVLTLTDTFTSEVFFKEMLQYPERLRKLRGLRQDSGDPFAFAKRAKEVYEKAGIDTTTKSIIYSDGLRVPKALELHRNCLDSGLTPLFGIGTSMTNDYRRSSTGEESRALNVVMKLYRIEGKPCVKLSDEPGKHHGEPEAIRAVKSTYNLEDA